MPSGTSTQSIEDRYKAIRNATLWRGVSFMASWYYLMGILAAFRQNRQVKTRDKA